MALENIQLRKLLKILFLEPNQRRSALRADIRDDRGRETGEAGSGGDFYGPFWADAKAHVFGRGDLTTATAARIAANARRRNLYPRLHDGFMIWWTERRRWTNEPFNVGRSLKSQFRFPGLDAIVKIDSVLTVQDGNGDEFAVYSYFAPEPHLTPDAARLGLWLLTRALPAVPPTQVRILDVIRGVTFSLDRNPLSGEEEIEFRARYARLIQERDELLREYD